MSRNGITVTAVGTASGPPDRAVLTLGASAIRGEVATALAAVNDKVDKLISTLAGYGIHGPDIQTSNLSIWPEHNLEGAVTGFRARNTVRITTTAVDALEELIGAATGVLGDLAEIVLDAIHAARASSGGPGLAISVDRHAATLSTGAFAT